MASYDYEIFENHRPQSMTYPKANIQDIEAKIQDIKAEIQDTGNPLLNAMYPRIDASWRWVLGEIKWRQLLYEMESLKIRREQRLRRDLEKAITHLESVYRFGESNGHNFDIKSLDPTKMTQEAYIKMNDVIKKLFLRAMITRCFIALKFFMGLMVESSDGKAKIQEIKAKIQDKFNYNGNCNVKIGIIPEGSGTPFLRWVYSGRLQWSKKFILHSWCCV